MANIFTKPSVLIVGGGEFGASTAVELLRSGNYSTVTVIDRAAQLPALDAASTDINKVVRFDYPDPVYAKLAREAIRRWNQPQWKGIYHQTGFIVRGLTHKYAMQTFENAKMLEPKSHILATEKDVAAKLSPSGKAALGKDGVANKSYWNPTGGWVHASGAVNVLYDEIKKMGGKLVPGAELASLIEENGEVRGVKCVDGREFFADKTIIALGSWTGGHAALKGVFPKGLLVPTGQCIAAVQLTPDEVERYKDMPTITNLDGSGYYSFPPNPDGLVKFALHANGYTVPNAVPRTAADPSAVQYTKEHQVGWIPRQSFKTMRQKFGEIFPELAAKPMAMTRMCWYSDTPDSDFVIDFSPKHTNLMIASGGAGHGFKFLPVIGELIHARFEGHLAPELVKKWAINRRLPTHDEDRQGTPRQPLKLDDLITAREMAAADSVQFGAKL